MASPLVRVVLGMLCLPLLVLLHVAFVLSSLALRLSELFFKAPVAPARDTDPPRHVAFVFKPSLRLSGAENGRRLVESTQRAVRWAAQSGVRELSIYTGQDMQSLAGVLRDEMGVLPPSPPSSPPLSPRIPSNPSLPGAKTKEGATMPVISLALYPLPSPPVSDDEDASPDRAKTRQLGVHLLQPSVREVYGRIASEYAARCVKPGEITVDRIDHDIRSHFPFPDPDLLILHPLAPLPTWRAFLPRPAPEIGGYPWWLLRVTEIYQHHPPDLPLGLPRFLSPVLLQARASRLPAVRKAARAVPLPLPQSEEGLFSRAEWEGALRAHAGVEQRLGR